MEIAGNPLIKFVSTNKGGFTLVEILLVMAIVGILGGIVFVSIGNQRERTRFNVAFQVAKSAYPFAQECAFKEKELQPLSADRANGYSGMQSGDYICQDSITQWPEITVADCGYVLDSSYVYRVNCGAMGSIVCDAQGGGCVLN